MPQIPQLAHTTLAQNQDWPGLASRTREVARAMRSRMAAGREGAERQAGGARRERVLVTGTAGFIGSHLVRRLVATGFDVVGVDDFNDYYDPVLKWENVGALLESPSFELIQADLRDLATLRAALAPRPPQRIVHLAARAGVRPSLQDPQLYMTVNVLGTQNVLDLARAWNVRHLVYASSSSVYGGSTEPQFREDHSVDAPISPYAASKKANELQATCYNRLYQLPVTGLRFFTVYGPAGRPDMAIRMFTERMDRGEPVPMFGDGDFERDYTYIDDIVDGVCKALDAGVDRPDCCEVFNLGESDTTNVRQLILMIATALGRLPGAVAAVKQLDVAAQLRLVAELESQGLVERRPLQPGDVPRTFADVSKARARLGYAPSTPIAAGIERTVAWHRQRKDALDPTLREALRLTASLRRRLVPDSLGRTSSPVWSAEDALAAARALDALTEASPEPTDALTTRATLDLAETLATIAAAQGEA